MTLTNRLTVFFLAALAVVLAAFSIALYSLARSHLYRQVDEQARANLDTLVAAAEIEPDGLEWDRGERTLWPKRDLPTVWAVFDARGNAVDGELDHVRMLKTHANLLGSEQEVGTSVQSQAQHWRVYRRAFSHPKSDIAERLPQSDQPRVPGDERYQSLVFVIASAIDPVVGMLRSLAWGLAGVSAVIWLVAAAGSRWMCRRALDPLTRMSEALRGIDPRNMAGRLPVPATRDELAKLATSFNELLGELQTAFERQRQFTGEASHQLRTPLTAMLGQMEVALRRDREPIEYRRVLAASIAQACRLNQTVDALLFLARADADSLAPGLETIDLAEWLPPHVAETWNAHPQFHNLRLDIPSRESVPIRVNRTLLGQAIDNLIDNAFKFSPSDGHVGVRVTTESGWTTVGVEDEGPGIAATDLQRVFDPFFRTDDARRRGVTGTGLGLAVTDRIVRSFGGWIEVRSTKNRGCAFYVVLPICRESTGEIADESKSATNIPKGSCSARSVS